MIGISKGNAPISGRANQLKEKIIWGGLVGLIF